MELVSDWFIWDMDKKITYLFQDTEMQLINQTEQYEQKAFCSSISFI